MSMIKCKCDKIFDTDEELYFKDIERLNNMEYTGNITADLLLKQMEDSISFEDQYICCECRSIVKEKEWSFENKICLQCIKENGE